MMAKSNTTADALSILTQTGDKHLTKKKNLYLAFADMERAFYQVPRNVCMLRLRKRNGKD